MPAGSAACMQARAGGQVPQKWRAYAALAATKWLMSAR